MNEFFTISNIKGRSMTPTLNPNNDQERDVVLVYKTQQVEMNDICIFKHPMNMALNLIKRVRGIQGDWCYYQNKGQTIPQGSVWFQGDESFRSLDSRDFGPVPRGLIIGKAIAIIWPLSRIKWL
jgi:inner membrane protease subunit 2